jgi:Leucine-rich repeat (LRR) protein
MNLFFKLILTLGLSLEVVKSVLLNQTLLINKYGYSIESLIIDLREKSISSIETNTFENFNRLEYLYLQNNKLSKIEKNTFTKLANLKELWLESNNIVFMDKYSLESLNELELVCLNDNPISVLFPNNIVSFCEEPLKCKIKVDKCIRKETSK